MQHQYTQGQLEGLPTAQLIILYNRLSSKAVKRFSSRAAGVKSILAELAKLPPPTVRTVRKASGDSKAGRPPVSFKVTLAEGRTEVQGKSLRGKILTHMRSLAAGADEGVSTLEEKFGKEVRGAIQKLIQVGWLKRVAQEQESAVS